MMKFFYLYIVFFLSFGTSLFAQTQISVGSAATTEVFNDVKYDASDGSTINVGSIGVSGVGTGTDCYLVKLNSSKQIVWQQSISNPGNDYLSKVQICANGDYVAVGEFFQNGLAWGFVCRINSATGNIIWSTTSIGTASTYGDQLYSIIETAAGNIAVAGSTDFMAGPVNSMAVLLGANGIQKWCLVSTYNTSDEFETINQLPNGNLIVCGHIYVGSSYKALVVELDETTASVVNQNDYAINIPDPLPNSTLNTLWPQASYNNAGNIVFEMFGTNNCCGLGSVQALYTYNQITKALTGNFYYHTGYTNTGAFAADVLGTNDYIITQAITNTSNVENLYVSRITNGTVVYDRRTSSPNTYISGIDINANNLFLSGSTPQNSGDAYSIFSTTSFPSSAGACIFSDADSLVVLSNTPTQEVDAITYNNVSGAMVPLTLSPVPTTGNVVVLCTTCTTTSTVDTTICLGQSYGGHGATGTYIDTLTNAAGCDSIRTLNLTINNCIPSPCPSIDSLIINTGYDPVSMAAIPIGQRDSNWIVTAMSTAMQNDPLDVCNPMPSPALVILNTDIVNIPPAPPNSQFISCLSNRIQSTTVPLSYTMTVERKFTLSTADIININMNISVDNILDQISIDGVPQTLNNLPFGSYSFVNYNFTVPLTEGYHTISITAQNVTVTPANYPNGYVFANGFDLIVVGTVKSTTGTNSLVNPNCTCSNPTFSIIDTAVCQGQNYLGYTATGTYIDTLTNVTGCDSIRTLNLTVTQKSFSTIDTSICQGQSFRGHTAAGTYIDTIPNVAGCDSIMTSNLTIKPKSFSTIPATICQGQNYLGYTNSGTFIDTLVAANGCDSIRTINLTVIPYSRSTIPMSICQGQNYFGHTTTGTFVDTLIATHGCDSIRTINLTVNSSSSSIVDTSICPGEASHGYTTGGTYTIILTNAVGCDSTITLNLTVKPSPVVKTNNDTSICKGTTLQVSTTGGTTYSWSPLTSLTFPDNNSDPIINTITPIQYIVTGTTNGCSASDTLNIGIDPLPIISKSNDATICVDSSTRIYANASGAFNFQWSPTSSLTFDHNVNDPIASPLVSTTYDVTVTDANNCVNSDSIKVTVRPPAVFTISPDANACANVSTQLFANGGDTYSWSPASLVSNASIKSPTTSITTTTTYNVQIKENTCGTSASLYTTLTLLPPLNVSASKSNDLDCYISSATLSATGADTYVWSPSTSLNNANIANPIARPFSTQQYIVKGTDELGCVGYDSVTVYGSFEDRLVYNMANAFTPNNDGLNDCYGIEYFGPISQFTFIIYNRWGQEMFHTNDPTACWNGTFQGQDAPVDAYVYYVRAVTACGTTEKKGTVVLIR